MKVRPDEMESALKLLRTAKDDESRQRAMERMEEVMKKLREEVSPRAKKQKKVWREVHAQGSPFKPSLTQLQPSDESTILVLHDRDALQVVALVSDYLLPPRRYRAGQPLTFHFVGMGPWVLDQLMPTVTTISKTMRDYRIGSAS